MPFAALPTDVTVPTGAFPVPDRPAPAASARTARPRRGRESAALPGRADERP